MLALIANQIAQLSLTPLAAVILATGEQVRGYTLAMGIAGIVGGIWLFKAHKRHFEFIRSSDEPRRVKAFEGRKYRRRSLVSAMVTSVGCMMSALFWVTDAKIFAIFMLLIISLLVAILIIAMFDFVSTGLHQIATPDKGAEKALLEECLRRREQALAAKQNEDELTTRG